MTVPRKKRTASEERHFRLAIECASDEGDTGSLIDAARLIRFCGGSRAVMNDVAALANAVERAMGGDLEIAVVSRISVALAACLVGAYDAGRRSSGMEEYGKDWDETDDNFAQFDYILKD